MGLWSRRRSDLLSRGDKPAEQTLENLAGKMRLIDPPVGLELIRDELLWEAIPAGESRTNTEAPKLRILGDVACGSRLSVGFRLFADNREVEVIKQFHIGQNMGEATVISAEGLPLPILDRQTTTTSVVLNTDRWTENAEIHKLMLNFDIRHTYVGDLTVNLVSPDGTKHQVYKGRGNGRDVHFEKDLTEVFHEVSAVGEWKLLVRDSARRDEGFLDNFKLTLVPKVFVCD